MTDRACARVVSHGSPEYEQCVRLRQRVLLDVAGIILTPDKTAQETKHVHIAAFSGERVVGCLFLHDLGSGILKMRQVAVEFGEQGKGIGRLMVELCEAYAQENGYNMIELNARRNAVPFYDALGYRREGDEFDEIGIPHLRMTKSF